MKYRMLWAGAVAGLAIHFGGLGWDVYRHSVDSTLVQREDALSPGNPSHLMIVVGMAFVAASLVGIAATWIHERQIGGRGVPGVLLRGLSLPGIGVVAAGSIWLAGVAEDGGRDPGVTAGEQVLGLNGQPQPEGPGAQDASAFAPAQAASGDEASAEGHTHDAADPENAMGEAAGNTHGTEVAATAEQMVAGGQFALAVKEKTAKYADISEGMRAGYVQITQDLEGIAAHFIRGDYQRDGRELDPEFPEVLLYSKRLDGTWRLVGVMFLAESASDVPPQYFGVLDAWHRHENLCFTAGARVSTTASAAECRGGVFVEKTAYQLHVWVLPGGNGVFAHDYAPISPGTFPPATIPAAAELRVQAR